jgi:tetratricopeptide (TPR) repeat protein
MYDDFEDDSDDQFDDEDFDINEALTKFESLNINDNVFFSEDEIDALNLHFLMKGEFENQAIIINHGLYLYPNKVDFLIDKAGIYVDKKQLHLALDTIEKAITLNPLNSEAYKLKAEILSDLNDFTNAELIYQKAIELSAFDDEFQTIDLYRSFADMYCSNDDLKKANHVISDALIRFPKSEALYHQLVQNHMSFGSLDNAIPILKTRIDKNPYSDIDWLFLGRVYELIRDKENAKEAYEYALIINPNSYDASFHLGCIYEDVKDYEKAIEHYIISKKDEEDFYPEVCIARCYLAIEDGVSARKHLLNCEQYQDLVPEYEYLTGYSYLVEKQPKKAIPYFEKAMLEDKEDISVIKGLLVCYFELNQLEKIHDFYLNQKETNEDFINENWKDFASVFYLSGLIDLFNELIDEIDGIPEHQNQFNSVLNIVMYDRFPNQENKKRIMQNLFLEYNETIENVKLFCPVLLEEDKEFKEALIYYKNSQDEQ